MYKPLKKTAEVEENYCSSCFLNTVEFNLLKAAECATAFQPFEWLVSLWHLIEIMIVLNLYYAVILIVFSPQNIEKDPRKFIHKELRFR